MESLVKSSLFELLIAAVLGYLVNLAVHKLTEIRAEDERRIGDLCDRIVKLSDISTDYFVRDVSSESDASTEAHVIGKTFWVQGAIVDFEENYCYFKNAVEKETLDFMDAVSGKNFQSANRQPDIHQAVDVQVTASKLVFAIRGARRKTVFSRWRSPRLR